MWFCKIFAHNYFFQNIYLYFQTNSGFKCSSIPECLGHLPHKGSVTLCFVLYLCCCENLALAWHFHAQANVCKMIQLSKLSAANIVWYKFNWNEYIHLLFLLRNHGNKLAFSLLLKISEWCFFFMLPMGLGIMLQSM